MRRLLYKKVLAPVHLCHDRVHRVTQSMSETTKNTPLSFRYPMSERALLGRLRKCS